MRYQVVTERSPLVIRNQPRADAPAVGSLAKGSVIDVDEDHVVSGFRRIKNQGHLVYWAASRYLAVYHGPAVPVVPVAADPTAPAVQETKYQREVYPARNDVRAYVNRLLEGLRRNYTQNVDLNGTPLRGDRSNPTEMHRVRVRALLDAWNQHISDRYVDYQMTRWSDRGFPGPRNTALIGARKELEIVAIRSLSSTLTNDPIITYWRMRSDNDYNKMYSILLNWCDVHCYGLPRYIYQYVDQRAIGGASTMPVIYQAAHQVIMEMYNRNEGVYSRYWLRSSGIVMRFFQLTNPFR